MTMPSDASNRCRNNCTWDNPCDRHRATEEEAASDASKPIERCDECVAALTIIEWSEHEDFINADDDEVQEAYEHLESAHA